MPATLIGSREPIADSSTGRPLANAAVLQDGGVVMAIGDFDDLSRRYRDAPVIGTGRDVLSPGFVNAHHHVGLTPLQLGFPDMPPELWWITRMVCRTVNPHLDTLYGAMDMISAGITTVQHIHGWVPGTAQAVEAVSDQVLRAHDEAGMRASYCYAVREQNRLVYADDAAFVATLPAALRGPMRAWFDRFRMSLDDMMGLFESLHAHHGTKRRTRVQLAPADLHWCSDKALGTLATAGGARTTGFENQVGRLAVGMAADMVLLDWDEVASPYLDPLTPTLDAMLQRARRSAVRTVPCDGEVIYDQGNFTRFDGGGVLQALHAELQAALSEDEMQRRDLSAALLPHVRDFYRRYIGPARHDPFYRQSVRH